jgi:hypothetical protein
MKLAPARPHHTGYPRIGRSDGDAGWFRMIGECSSRIFRTTSLDRGAEGRFCLTSPAVMLWETRQSLRPALTAQDASPLQDVPSLGQAAIFIDMTEKHPSPSINGCWRLNRIRSVSFTRDVYAECPQYFYLPAFQSDNDQAVTIGKRFSQIGPR